jgi:hypothetical protein
MKKQRVLLIGQKLSYVGEDEWVSSKSQKIVVGEGDSKKGQSFDLFEKY